MIAAFDKICIASLSMAMKMKPFIVVEDDVPRDGQMS